MNQKEPYFFFCPSPLPFGGCTVLSLTRGPAGNRTTTGSLSAAIPTARGRLNQKEPYCWRTLARSCVVITCRKKNRKHQTKNQSKKTKHTNTQNQQTHKEPEAAMKVDPASTVGSQVNWYGEKRKQQNKKQHKSPYERHVGKSNTALCGNQELQDHTEQATGIKSHKSGAIPRPAMTPSRSRRKGETESETELKWD